jgi:hypothetical protein
MFSQATRAEIDAELSRAKSSQAEGFEGRARVCARRAAGAAIREYHRFMGRSGLRANAYDLLAGMKTEPGLSEASRQAIDFLLLRVDEEFRLPEEIDLLEESRRLIAELEGKIQDL